MYVCMYVISYAICYRVKLSQCMYCVLTMCACVCVCMEGAVGAPGEVKVHSADGLQKETVLNSVLAA